LIHQQRLVVLSVVFTMALGLSLTLSPSVLPWYGVALSALACAAVPYLLHTHPSYTFSPLRLILPATIALAAPFVAHELGDGPFRLVGVFGPGALLYGVILAEYLVVRPAQTTAAQAARLLLTLAAYSVALAFFLLTYEVKERSLVSGTIIGAISGALALRLLTIEGRSHPRAPAYATVAALIMAELLWPLNYWILSVVAGGLALLLAFYVLIGLMRPLLLEGQLDRAILLEYGTVSLAGLAVVFGATKL
jgi:hypothetical protein